MNGKAIVDMEQNGNLIGKIIFSDTLNGSVKTSGEIYNAKASISTDHETYNGEYNVIPKIEEQTLNTSDKLMLDDVKIKAIPFYEVSNPYNGETVIIGGNV